MSDQDNKSKPTKRGTNSIRKPSGESIRKSQRRPDEIFEFIEQSFPSQSSNTTVANSFAPPTEGNLDKSGKPKTDK